MGGEEGLVRAANRGRRVAEVTAKSILSPSGLADYAVNCYRGCEHACIYCYARFITRFTHPREPWGSFIDVKANAAELLTGEVTRKRPGRVYLSSVCDAWQPLEASYGLTRRCLETLLRHNFPVRTLTKSALAGRDLDLLAGRPDVEFGVTITTLDSRLARLIEPRTALPAARLALLAEASRRGVTTYAFLGPLMPFLSDDEAGFTALLRAVKETGVSYCYVDRLNPRFGVWGELKALLETRYPDLVAGYRRLFFHPAERAVYSTRLLAMVNRAAAGLSMGDRMRLCF